MSIPDLFFCKNISPDPHFEETPPFWKRRPSVFGGGGGFILHRIRRKKLKKCRIS